jgi:two-component system response regulator VicR
MKRILICEDEKDTQESIKNILMKRNYEVYTAQDGQDSINKTKELKPNLILLDIRMPKIDGIEVANEVRKFDNNVKIIFITAFQSPQIAKETSKYNISDYLAKPVAPKDILKAVEDALST